MRILFLTSYVPTPIRVRSLNLLRTLVRCGHTVTLLCIAQGQGLWARHPAPLEMQALEEVRALGIRTHVVLLPHVRSLLNCLRALPTPLPLQAVYCWSPLLAHRFREEFSRRDDPYNVAHIEHLRGARYGLQVPASNQVPLIWDSVDCISHLFEQSSQRGLGVFAKVLTRLELPRTRRYEAMLVRRFARTLVTSPLDAAALGKLGSERYAPGPEPSILPNGVDLAYFSPDDTLRQADEIVFSGKMSYHANVTAATFFVREVLPRIQDQWPSVHLTIAGSSPAAAVQGLASAAVTVTGYVPDLRPYLRRAAVAVAPMLYAAGIQNRVLEAMACATPVVATPAAISALAVRPGHEVLVGETPAELANHILGLLADPVLGRELGRAGRDYVEQNHDWQAVVHTLEQIYRQETAAGQSGETEYNTASNHRNPE